MSKPEEKTLKPGAQMAEYRSRQRKRSIAIALGLALLVAIFYALTIVKLGPAIFQRDL